MRWIFRWFSWSTTPEERSRRLSEEGRFAEALQCIDDETLQEEILRMWLAEVIAVGRTGDAEEARAAFAQLTEAAGDAHASVLTSGEWQLREALLCASTDDPDLEKLVRAAGVQTRRIYGSRGTQYAPRHQLFLDRNLTATLGEAADGPMVSALPPEALEPFAATLGEAHPDALWPAAQTSQHLLTRAILFLAVGRPDLAIPPLLSIPVTCTLRSFELARCAHALGYSALAVRMLEEFSEAAGHQQVHRMHSALLLAQIHLGAGNHAGVLETLDTPDAPPAGASTSLLRARALIGLERTEEAVATLRSHPDHSDCAALLADLEGRQPPAGSANEEA